jgi:hypothetical protein
MRCSPAKERLVLDWMVAEGMRPRLPDNFSPLNDFTDGVLDRLSIGIKSGKPADAVNGHIVYELIMREEDRAVELSPSLAAELALLCEYRELRDAMKKRPGSGRRTEDDMKLRASTYARIREIEPSVRALLASRREVVIAAALRPRLNPPSTHAPVPGAQPQPSAAA